ncbi:MAG: FAD:protein FMN transferase [Gammaproteobacteria bacterium]|nr:FAD:protein FMN transferase [Gammaproteobacteria bacterium]
MRKIRFEVLLVAAIGLVVLASCDKQAVPGAILELNGPVMGTRFNVQVVGMPESLDKEALAAEIRATLDGINATMSTYLAESEVSQFNQYAGTDWFPVSASTAKVTEAAQKISAATGGAFDITVGPLVNIWGFGPESALEAMPDRSVIAAVSERIGYQKLDVRVDPPALKKSEPDLYIDLSAIAKGYAVDVVCDLLADKGLENFLVDIGGELRFTGRNAQGDLWRVAIENPRGDRKPYEVLSLEGGAVATSGNYRNYFEIGGQRFSHTIDPRTGRPVNHSLVLATIVSDEAMTADGWATAMIVLGAEEGIVVAEREGLAALLLSEDGESLREASSSAMESLRD